MSESGSTVGSAPAEVATSLHRGTNWWGAFVIGLAGTILVTGIVPFAVQSMGAAAIPAIALVVVIGMIVCLCMGELAALLPHRTGGMPSYAYESFSHSATNGQTHRWTVGVGLLARMVPGGADQHAARCRLYRGALPRPSGHTFSPLGSLGTPVSIGVLVDHLHRAYRAVHPVLLGHPPGGNLRHHPRDPGDGAADPAGAAAGVQAELLPLVEHLGLPLRRPEDRRHHLLPVVDLRHLMERDRHGGGRLLHR